jgi:hypothetical protein
MDGEGASVIGDGLASCVLSFPKLTEDRSRIIILATDNLVNGAQIITVPEAAELAKKYKISIYPIAPDKFFTKETEELKNIASKTGGKYYILDDFSSANEIINDIEQKEKKARESNPVTTSIDYPTLPFIVTLLSILVLLVMERVVKL